MGQTTKWSSVAASENGVYIWYTKNWLVVWNFFYFPYIGNNHPCLRTHIFQRGRLNHQPEMAISHERWMISDGISGDFILQKISGMGIGWYVGIRTYYDNSASLADSKKPCDNLPERSWLRWSKNEHGLTPVGITPWNGVTNFRPQCVNTTVLGIRSNVIIMLSIVENSVWRSLNSSSAIATCSSHFFCLCALRLAMSCMRSWTMVVFLKVCVTG